jgi:CRP-like cAMP-binding protein
MTHAAEVCRDDGTREDLFPSKPISAPRFIHLDPGDYLYREADLRTDAYRIEKGAFALFSARMRSVADSGIVVQGKGRYIGLGFFERHIVSARAIAVSSVSCVSKTQVTSLLDNDAKLRLDYADAVDREFEYRKAQVIGQGPLTPLRRLAALLASEVQLSICEGYDPSTAAECLNWESAGNLLGLDQKTFAAAVRELENLGFLEETRTTGFRLKNIEGLGRL